MSGSRRPFASDHDGADEFVESLFGHPKSDRKTSRTGQSPTKQPRRISNYVRVKSVKILPSAHGDMTQEEVQWYELDKMEKAESEQRKVDRFWGLDKETADCQRERVLMTVESENSLLHESLLKAALKRRLWEEDERKKAYEKAYTNSIREGQARKVYMRSFYQASSSADIMFFNWPTRQHVQAQPNSTEDSRALEQDGIERMVEEYLRRSDLGFDIVDVMQSNSSIHLGGRQQSHLLSSVESDPATSGVTRGGNAVVALKAIRPLDFGRRSKSRRMLESKTMLRSSSTSLSPQRTRFRSGQSPGRSVSFTAGITSSRPGTAGGLTSGTDPAARNDSMNWKDRVALDLLPKPKHLDALDGHPVYKWDQVMILRQVYSRLDASSDGGVDDAKLINIRNDTYVLSLLRYTVLGVWVKRKQWAKFQALLGSHTSISLLDLVQGARAMSCESRVSPRLVRTDAEHRALVLEEWKRQVRGSGDDAAKDDGFAAHFAQEQRRRWDRSCRDAFLSRSLSQGDCVWGMIGGAGVWLPAVVEMVNDNGTYDLSYPLTLASLQQAKVMATSRELLALPTQPAGPMVTTKAFSSEKDVCTYVFDLVASGDSNGPPVDTVDAQKLWNALRSPKFSNLVRTSVALSLVVSGAKQYNYSQPDEFLAIFFREFTVDGRLRRIEFVDYCTNLQEMVAEMNQLQ